MARHLPASSREEFNSLVKEYEHKLPPISDPHHRDDVLTPAEVLARAGEHYVTDRQGIHNRCVDTSQYDKPEHQPFKDPDFSRRIYNFWEDALTSRPSRVVQKRRNNTVVRNSEKGP